MARVTKLVAALLAGGITVIGLQAVPAVAATGAVHNSAIVGELGVEGGAYPNGFQPTAGSVEVEFNSVPLVLLKHVGQSGKFDIKLSPGSYTVIGCGPQTSGNQCSKPQVITLATGEVDHIQLVWAYRP